MALDFDFAQVLLELFIVLIVAKVAAEIAERARVPVVVAEIVAGIIVGPSILNWVPSINETPADQVFTAELLFVLGEIGVIILLLEVGLAMRISELREVGRSAVAVALIGVALPMLLGWGTTSAFGVSGDVALFVGAALAATSVGITARVFAEMRALGTVEARTVLGAAVIDDVLGLVILTVVVGVVAPSEGPFTIGTFAEIILKAAGFLVIAVVIGVYVASRGFNQIQRLARSRGTLIAVTIGFTAGVAFLAEEAQLAPIIGAFVAGLALAESKAAERIRTDIEPISSLLVPIFFLEIGVNLELSALFEVDVLLVALGLLTVAMVGKVVAGWGVFGKAADRLTVGLGMLPRGEVGLIFASIGLQEGVLESDLYGALLVVVLGTTLMAPPLLRWRVDRVHRAGYVVDAHPPEGGWLQLIDGRVEIVGSPPRSAALHLALPAALLVNDAEPAPSLLEWAGTLDAEPLPWDDEATGELLRLLRSGAPRAWRFLELSGVLQRALPELADAVQRRGSSPYILDPNAVLSWSTVEHLRELPARDPRAAVVDSELSRPEWALFAALALDVTDDRVDTDDIAKAMIDRLGLPERDRDAILGLVRNRDLFTSASRRVDGLEPGRVDEIFARVGSQEEAEALYLLTLARESFDATERERLDELIDQIEARF